MSNKIASMKKHKEAKQTNEIVVTLADLLSSQQALNVLASDNSIPIDKSFRLGKVYRAAALELEAYQMSRKALCERFTNMEGDKPKMVKKLALVNGAQQEVESYDIPEEKMAEFDSELEKLTAVKVAIPQQRFKPADFGSVRIAAAHMARLDWLFE